MLNNKTAEGVFLALVSAMLNDKKPFALPERITADDIFSIGSRQDMAPITFCALNSISPKPVSEKWGDYQKRFLDDCMRSEIQMSEYHKLVDYLCSHDVKIIPLKGCVIKELYPAPNLRVMSDVDLLYEGVTPKQLAQLMESFGYSTESLEKIHHDVFHKKPCMSIELHRQLIRDDSPYKSVLDDMFAKAVPDQKIPNLYNMKPEDLYIHVIVHAANHFKYSGLGVRPVGDIYILNREYGGNWDRGYIESQLKTVGLEKFEKKMRDVASAFFGEEEKELSDMDMMYFFRGSTYGKLDLTWNYITKGGRSRIRFFLGRIFIPYSTVKKMYPVVGKIPLLYPFSWLYRIVDVLLHRRRNVARVASAKVNNKDTEYAQNIMTDFGLDA